MNTAFYEIKRLVVWPLVFFDGKAPILLQLTLRIMVMVGDQERITRFLSKSLPSDKVNWSTYEKGAWAIVCALRELEPLLRDAEFTLRTDRRNLFYLCKEYSLTGNPVVDGGTLQNGFPRRSC